MAAGVIVLLVVVGGASYFIGQSTGGTKTSTSTATRTVTQQGQTVTQTAAPLTQIITQSITQTSTITNTQTSTSTFTTTASPVNFTFVPKPSNVNATIPPGVKLRFLQYIDPGGVTLHAALWEPQTGQAKVAVITIPGSGGNYTYNPRTFGQTFTGYVSAGLAARGYAVFTTETRAGVTPRLDSAYDVPMDINAAVSVVKSLGYTNIILAGFSLGGQSVVQYAAVFRDPAVKGLVLNGAVANGPWRAKDGLANCAAGAYQGCNLPAGLYGLMYNESKTLISQGKPYTVLPQQIPLAPWNGAPIVMRSWSATYFMSYFSPQGVVTDSIIGQVTVPIITIRDQADSQNRAFENTWLVGNATAPGSLVPSLQNVIMPNSHAPYFAAHTFDLKANGPLILSTIDAWIQGLNLK